MNREHNSAIRYESHDRRIESLIAFRDPKKHYVRKFAWLPKARERLQKVSQEDHGYLRYFTLCGPEIIDVKYLAGNGVLRHDQRGYPDVVFCESDDDFYAKAISKLGNPLAPFRMSFEDVLLQHRLDKYCPFDIYNLDFTRSCFPHWDPPTSRTIQAVQGLFEIQGKFKQPFDLFLTFRAERGREQMAALRELKDYMQRNFEENEELRQSFSAKFRLKLDELMRVDYLNFILITFPKLMAFLGQDQNFLMTDVVRLWYRRVYTNDRTGLRCPYLIIKFVFSFETVRVGRSVSRRDRRSDRLRQNYIGIARKCIEEEAVDVGAS